MFFQCTRPRCKEFAVKLLHVQACVAGEECPFQHCFKHKLILRHWNNCKKTNSCELCATAVICQDHLNHPFYKHLFIMMDTYRKRSDAIYSRKDQINEQIQDLEKQQMLETEKRKDIMRLQEQDKLLLKEHVVIVREKVALECRRVEYEQRTLAIHQEEILMLKQQKEIIQTDIRCCTGEITSKFVNNREYFNKHLDSLKRLYDLEREVLRSLNFMQLKMKVLTPKPSEDGEFFNKFFSCMKL